MAKKSTASKLKALIYPLAFILIVILSALYKFVFKGNGDLRLKAYKGGKTASVIETSDVPVITADSSESPSSENEASQSSETVPLISIYICGEVRDPGIYEVPKGVLLNDIIEDAGGLTENASVNNINFVYRVECNMSVYIPSEDEITKGMGGGDIIRQDGVYVWGVESGGAGGQAGSGQQDRLMVNINTATVDELKSLPGIGEVTAQAIEEYRRTNPFKTVEDIKNVTGIGDSKYNRIKDHICV